MISATCDVCGRAATVSFKIIQMPSVGARPLLIGPEASTNIIDLCDGHAEGVRALTKREETP